MVFFTSRQLACATALEPLSGLLPRESCHNLYPAPGLACYTPGGVELAAGPPRSATMLTRAKCTTALRPAAGKAARSRYADNTRANAVLQQQQCE